MGLSLWQVLVILLVVLIVFGAGRLPSVMGDLGKGVRKFKEGLNGGQDENGKDKPFLSAAEKKDADDSKTND